MVVLLDALGTLVELQPPAPRLQRLLDERGFEVDEERAAAGFAAEISYYLGHHLEGSSRERLDDLRDRCATAMMDALDLPGLDHAVAREAMLGSLEFTAFPDVLPALAELRSRGHVLVVVSNWDCSLPDWLGPAGVLEHVEAVVTSAEVGVAKPGREVFEQALALAGAAPGGAMHVGDSLDNDVAGARAVGHPRRPGCARRHAAGRGGGGPLARRAARPTLRAMRTAVPPPPTPPELPEEARPRWPWWYGPLGFLAGAITGFITAGILWAVAGCGRPIGLAGGDRGRHASCWTGRWSGRRCCSPRSCAGRGRGTSACGARASGRRLAGPRSGS